MKLIKLSSDHYIIVDDSEIKEGDWMCLQQGNTPSTKQGEIARCEFADANNLGVIWKKITHSTFSSVIDRYKPNTPLILNLSEVKELLGEVDVEEKAEQYASALLKNSIELYAPLEANVSEYVSFIAGYNQALEDNEDRKYTEEDMRKAMDLHKNTSISLDDIIQSLQPPTSWDVVFVDGKLKLL